MGKAAALVLGASLVAATQAAAMELSSPGVAPGSTFALSHVYSECGGGNLPPALNWNGAPAGTKSFVVTMFDPDAHGGWWHWIVYNIPPSVMAISGGAPPGAREGRNDFGKTEYDGPCPPPGSGVHHYQMTVWALGTPTLPTEGATEGKIIGPYLQAHALASATLTATYER
jgi:Raf kinase inhibitor-like YbhB/YbcL family protein